MCATGSVANAFNLQCNGFNSHLIPYVTVGAMFAGIPMSYLARITDWWMVFLFNTVTILVIFFILVISKDMKATYLSAGGGPPRLSKNKTTTATEEPTSSS